MTARGPATGWLCRIVLLDLAHVRLLKGDAAATLEILAPLSAQAQATRAHDHLIEILTLQALALDHLGRRTQALNTLIQAFELGEPEGYIRPFLDAGMRVDELIRATLRVLTRVCVTRPTLLTYIRHVLDAFSRSPDIYRGRYHASIEQLTARELEILRLISEGYSNEEIARTLIISINTVKWHVKTIYGKLGAQRRTQAVAQARRLGLLAG
jgi:LuxR family maltose regulon positive regulatory protein